MRGFFIVLIAFLAISADAQTHLPKGKITSADGSIDSVVFRLAAGEAVGRRARRMAPAL